MGPRNWQEEHNGLIYLGDGTGAVSGLRVCINVSPDRAKSGEKGAMANFSKKENSVFRAQMDFQVHHFGRRIFASAFTADRNYFAK